MKSVKVQRVPVTAAPLRQQVANNLRTAIIDGRFQPGERLKESELCSWTGVSRTAVREALRQLEAEGIVDNIPNQGPVVTRVSPDEARQHYEVRSMLEGLTARIAAERISEPQIKELHGLKRNLDRAFKSGRVAEVLECKNHLDEFLMSVSANSVVKGFVTVIRARLSYLRPIVLSQPERLKENAVEVRAIIDAIIARKPQAAWQAAVNHVNMGAKATLKVLDQLEAAAARQAALEAEAALRAKRPRGRPRRDAVPGNPAGRMTA
ncbi:GntR family transcriptional regulator [Bradyrhizobium sp. KB893862 SZCCT0404]|uniref:GntR family transcriptional regulator n=1 Tax=Bradyrhizobium sp. KB893862 SZCCT0404 TaxID=2807672 RepID=UPI001BA43E03|nr:GntR family transcriptional regulator [Bradyrhizobium sp. KB893862 SZCCT0404]MBR1175245.1 GntR family transcriptional regulator [Bradyrhizobium sp. KB893862 SZCCT0404]